MTTRRAVRRIDHLFVSVEGAEKVFDMLRSRLGLVVLLPVTDWGRFTSGAFNLGNIYLEILEPQPMLPKASLGALEVNGLAFEPVGIDGGLAELERREIACVPPVQLVAPEDVELASWNLPLAPARMTAWASGSLLFTNFVLPGLAGGNALVFCCQTEWLPISELREGMRQKLDEMPDRPLPIDSASEVVIGTTDFDAERHRWQTLLEPTVEEEPGLWRFEGGPALRLVEHDRDSVVGLKLRVGDLERSERYLKEHDMLASRSGDELVIARDALGGLDVSLVPSGGEVPS